jgi:hypothetical protein
MAVDPQIRLVMTALEGFTENLIRKMAFDVVANLRKAGSEGGTPVDTGWARANWIPSMGGEPAATPSGTKESVSSAEASLQAGLGSLLGYKLLLGPVFITNNVPYILKLNDGHSQQAPSGFVQAAITAAVAMNAA